MTQENKPLGKFQQQPKKEENNSHIFTRFILSIFTKDLSTNGEKLVVLGFWGYIVSNNPFHKKKSQDSKTTNQTLAESGESPENMCPSSWGKTTNALTLASHDSTIEKYTLPTKSAPNTSYK